MQVTQALYRLLQQGPDPFVDALPISGAGKILKRELRKQYWDTADRNVS